MIQIHIVDLYKIPMIILRQLYYNIKNRKEKYQIRNIGAI